MKYKGDTFNMWDAWYVNVNGTVHGFHLKMQPGDWDVGHVTTTDLLHFTTCPSILQPLDETTHPDDCGGKHTGGAYYDEAAKKAYVYYTMRSRCGSEKIGVAISEDMVNFPEYESNPVISVDPTLLLPDSRPAGGSDCRDMVVVKNPADGRYYGYFAAMSTIKEGDTRGVIAVAVSDDLLTWTDQRIVYIPRFAGVIEVPDVFYMDGKWYLTFLTANIYGAHGAVDDPNLMNYTLYATADNPLGPFCEEEDNVFLGGTWDSGYSCRSVEWEGKRYVLYIDRSDYGAAISWPKEIRVVEGRLRPCYTPLLKQLRTENHLFPTHKQFEARSSSFAWKTGDGTLCQKEDTLVAEVGRYSHQQFFCTAFQVPSLEVETTITVDGAEGGICLQTYNADGEEQAVYTVSLNAAHGELTVYIGRNRLFSAEYLVHSKRLYPIKPHVPYHLRVLAAEGQFEIYLDDVLALQGNMHTEQALRPGLFCAMGQTTFRDLQFYELEQ